MSNPSYLSTLCVCLLISSVDGKVSEIFFFNKKKKKNHEMLLIKYEYIDTNFNAHNSLRS